MALAEKAREKVAPLNVRNDGRGRRGGLRGGRGNGHDRSPKTEGSGGQAAALRRHPVPFPFTPSPSLFAVPPRSEEHTSELQSLMLSSYADCCLTKKRNIK